ncbi:MAG: phage BR0599 family protein [Rickettsiaceae bacterium]|nr:phage BR0599 family protein [Rickettsiaceae bacterium]MDD9337455.1 phage BR0599 family protein [Rickettsiaceae bacterium]
MTVAENIDNPIAELQGFTYCFHITLQDGFELYLTESDRYLSIDNVIFVPNSGVTLKEGGFNDSAQNYIILEGVFENEGVKQHYDLTQAMVKIYVCFANSCRHFVTYRCITYTKRDLDFTLRLEPNIDVYNQSLLQSFSKNCRANFGDLKCKIDKTVYSQIYNIKEMFGRTMVISNLDKENGYFNYGDAILNGLINGRFCSKILSNSENLVILDQLIPDSVKHNKTVQLIAGCDKKFTTCCNKFNNAVNFRGEPLIPDDNFIKVI